MELSEVAAVQHVRGRAMSLLPSVVSELPCYPCSFMNDLLPSHTPTLLADINFEEKKVRKSIKVGASGWAGRRSCEVRAMPAVIRLPVGILCLSTPGSGTYSSLLSLKH